LLLVGLKHIGAHILDIWLRRASTGQFLEVVRSFIVSNFLNVGVLRAVVG
jgi:hypothetical protein